MEKRPRLKMQKQPIFTSKSTVKLIECPQTKDRFNVRWEDPSKIAIIIKDNSKIQ